MCRTCYIIAIVITTLANPQTIAAEPDGRAVAERVRKYSGHFHQSRLLSAQQAKIELRARMDELDALIQTSRKVNRAKWKKYLMWQELSEQINASKPDVHRLQAISKRYYDGQKGLSIKQFLDVREALDNYIDRLIAAQGDDLRAQYERRIAELAAMFERQNGRPTSDELGEQVSWLTTTGQARGLSAWIQRKYSQPNMIIHISSDLLGAALEQFQQDIDQTQMMTRQVAGVAVNGLTRTQAKITAKMVPTSQGAALRLQLKGIASSPENVATQGPVSVFSSGTCQLFATKDLRWTDDGIVAGPTHARCQTQSALTGVNVHRNRLLAMSQGGMLDQFIGNIAMNQAAEMQPQAEQDANRLAEQELTTELDAQVGKQLDDLNDQVNEFYRVPMTRLGMLPKLTTHMTAGAVRVDLTRPGPGELAAPNRPNYKAKPGTFSFSFHESALLGFLNRFARGAKWDDRFLSELQRTLVGDNSYEMRIGPHKPWSVHLDWSRPVTARFTPEAVEVELRARQLTIDGQRYNYAFAVRSRYTIHPTRTAPRFERVGDIELEWLAGGPTLSAERDMLVEFLTRKFRGFYLDEFYTDGLAAPAGGQWGNLSEMRVTRIQLEPGWMTAILGEKNPKPKE